MTKNEEEKNELMDFNDLESRELRDYNRGAVLANIHDKYLSDQGTIHNRAMRGWLNELSDYLARIPNGEHQSAKDAMKLHLMKRGVG